MIHNKSQLLSSRARFVSSTIMYLKRGIPRKCSMPPKEHSLEHSERGFWFIPIICNGGISCKTNIVTVHGETSQPLLGLDACELLGSDMLMLLLLQDYWREQLISVCCRWHSKVFCPNTFVLSSLNDNSSISVANA